MMPANHLWQSTAFGVAAALLALALRKNRAQVRYAVWLAASVKFLIPFALLVTAGSHFVRHQTAAAGGPATFVSAPVWMEQAGAPFAEPLKATARAAKRPSIAVWLWAAWAAGFLTVAISWGVRWMRLRAAVGRAAAVDLGVGLAVRQSREFGEPGVFGIWRPVLLLPEGIEERLSAREMEAIVAHELCHVKRNDNLATAVHMTVEALYWFHPLVWWIGGRLMEERERACDEEVLRAGSEAEAYAEGILKVCENYLANALPCVAGVTGGDLKRRIEAIVSGGVASRLTAAKKAALAAAGIGAVAIPLLVGISHAPVILAQTAAAQAAGPKFDAASIKPCQASDPGGRGRGGGGGGGGSAPVGIPSGVGGYFAATPGRMDIRCGSILTMVNVAYEEYGDPLLNQESGPGSEAEKIHGLPGWALAPRYTIHAETDDAVANGPTEGGRTEAWNKMMGPMLRALLEERFALKVHREEAPAPMYALRVAKGGPKMKPVADGDCTPLPPRQPNGGLLIKRIGVNDKPYCGWMGSAVNGPNRVVMGGGIPLKRLAQFLSDFAVDRHVLDETGLDGEYNIHLEYVPDENQPCRGPASTCEVDPTSAIPPGPSIFGALEQQYGLKLEAVHGPQGYIVIDHVERPSEN